MKAGFVKGIIPSFYQCGLFLGRQTCPRGATENGSAGSGGCEHATKLQAGMTPLETRAAADCHTFVTRLTWFCSVVFAPLPAMRKNETNRQAAWLTSLLMIPAVLCADNALCAEAASNNTSDSIDLLLNLFIEKGYVSNAEAEKVKAEAEKRKAELEQYKVEAEQYKTETEQLKADVAQLKAGAEFNQTNAVPS
jgi:hypothetical protein